MTTLFHFLPEILMLTLVTALLSLSLASRKTAAGLVQPVLLFFSAAVAAAAVATFDETASLFSGTYRVDALSQGFKALMAVALGVTALLAEKPVGLSENRRTEFALFLATSSLGMMMLASAADLLTLYVSLELSSFSLYVIAALRGGRKNAEASVKYLLFGTAASGLFLWGVAALAGLAGTTSLPAIAAAAPAISSQPAFIMGAAFVSLAFLFKLSGFPMQFWAPDVYETAPTPAVTFIATASKAAAVAVFIRVFAWVGVGAELGAMLAILAFFSMTIGNTAALLQKDAKRLLAYSSIAQAGYLMLGLLTASFEGYSSAFFYAVAYVLMNAGAFLVLTAVGRSANDDNPSFSHFDGLADRSPFLSLLLLLSLLSLAGIPPLVGFTAKWVLFSAAMDQGHWFLVLWAVLNSVVSLFYYLTLVKHAYLMKPRDPSPIRLDKPVAALAFFLIIAIVVAGVYPNPLVSIARAAVGA